jgi:hypothetical protein
MSIAVSSSTSAFHDILERFAAEAESALVKFAAEAETAAAESRTRARTELAGQLNQAVRRIRQSPTRDDLGETVADTAAAFASGAAWFLIADAWARCEKLDLTIPLPDAAALKEAVDTREPIAALAGPVEVSPQLVERFAHSAQSRAFVYPILAAEKITALLYTWTDQPAGAQHSALELLAQVASAAWLALEPPPPPPPLEPLIAIAPAPKPAHPWEALSAEEQQIHLRAQRYARVQVAEMRLRNAAAVQSGRLRRNLYVALHDSIDAARDAFRKDFFTKSPSMVDYLHLELTRTLANDDADLLGKDYPGPMV